jgi:hypothetical protein
MMAAHAASFLVISLSWALCSLSWVAAIRSTRSLAASTVFKYSFCPKR